MVSSVPEQPIEVRVAAQLEIHEAKLRAIENDIAALHDQAVRLARAGKTDQAKSALRQKKIKEGDRDRTREFRDFYQSVILKIEHVASVNVAMNTFGQARVPNLYAARANSQTFSRRRFLAVRARRSDDSSATLTLTASTIGSGRSSTILRTRLSRRRTPTAWWLRRTP